jgi:Domain of unknown function (DUF4411)
MKRRGGAPLFRETDPVYLIDTSAWSNMYDRPDFETIWRIVLTLIEKGRVVVCAPVFDELENEPIVKRLRLYEKALRVGDEKSDNPDYLLHVGKITHAYPSMSKARSKKSPADPYVIALAERESYVVVADESKRRPNRKIPGVCEKRGIPCKTLDEFIADNSTNAAGTTS